MNNSNPKVSVILPTYNRETTIRRAIDSVLKQTYVDFELLIVDDGSTDHTKEIIAEIEDPRVKYIKLPINRGAAFARNSGIRAAKGEHIAFQDSDDEWMPDKLLLQAEVMNSSGNDVGLVYTGFYYERPEGRLEWPPKNIPVHMKNGSIFPYMLTYNPVGGPTMLVRKECFRKVGMFDAQLRSMEDYELALRISRYYKLILIDELLVKAYETAGSLSKNIMAHVQTSCLMLKLYKEDFLKYNLMEQKLEEFRKLASRVLNAEQIEQMLSLAIQ